MPPRFPPAATAVHRKHEDTMDFENSKNKTRILAAATAPRLFACSAKRGISGEVEWIASLRSQ
jgi:hypothetical protein